ncbi:NAD(P)-binding protein [Adlercreutzia aquisgranensis]|uniref:FAD-binding protein n=1 Tax=Muribaculaceae bacterium Z82 TaxID=2304548 RepID=A0A7C9JK16_9BACT|nr:NAD(P)-binding protein [Adlercreutzia aquisgranensis]
MKKNEQGARRAVEGADACEGAGADAKSSLTRRGLMGAAATMGLPALAAGMLAGCQPAGKSAEDASGADAADAGDAATQAAAAPGNSQGPTASAVLNPQDPDFRSNTIQDFSKTTLFSPLKWGSRTLANRMIKASANSGTIVSTMRGPAVYNIDATVEYYRMLAQNGIGAIILEDKAWKLPHIDETGNPKQQQWWNEIGLERVVEAVHETDTPVLIQLASADYRWSNTPEKGTVCMASELSDQDIANLIADYVTASQNMQSLGFDGVEINAAANNSGAYFLSRHRNDRDLDDPYGPATLENRARLVTEAVRGIKEACGADFHVQVLINGVEDNDASIGQSTKASTVEEVAAMAKLIEAAGADSLHLRLGVYGIHEAQFVNDAYFGGYGIDGTSGYGTFFDFSKHFGGILDASHSGCGLMLNAAAKVKGAVSIPVGAVTFMDPAHAPDFFEQALAGGKVDFLMINRAAGYADYEYVSKLKDGRVDEIRSCCRCLHCVGDFGNHTGVNESCRMNPAHGRAFGEEMPEGFKVPAGDGQKKVVVGGGGPAGMEAARVCAERGYDVTLFEKSSSLGGLLDFAHTVKEPHENLDRARSYLSHMLDVTGVNVVTGQEADAAAVQAENPDVVFVATGGLRPSMSLQGTQATPVVGIVDAMFLDDCERVLIAGFNAQALDLAWYLLA